MILRVLAVLVALALPAAALAEPIFPAGSRLGLVPPAPMTPSERFTGFEEPNGAAITLLEMPQEAFAELTRGLDLEALKAQGLTVESREDLRIDERPAVLVTGDQEVGGVPVRKWVLVAQDASLTAFAVGQRLKESQVTDAAMRAALLSLAVRPPLSVDDQIAALPFRIGDRAGFRPVRAMGGNAIYLTDGPADQVAAAEQPILILARSNGPPPPPGPQRDAFARAALLESGILDKVAIERSETFRQKGAEWHEIVARAVDARSGQAVVVTQTLRFAPDHYMRMLGVARSEIRTAVLPRFRALFDSVEGN
jgi:hypothetical protein